jgi:hypothetical protein
MTYSARRAETMQPIRLGIDGRSHLAGVVRGVVFGIALLVPVIATAFGPAVRQPYKSEATVPACDMAAAQRPAACASRESVSRFD